jgi:EmrB/QacA subfamily drug resistance transporter
MAATVDGRRGRSIEPAGAGSADSEQPDGRETRKRLTVAVVAAGALMTTLDATVVNVALPVIRSDFGYLHVTVSELQWVVNAYALTFAAFLLTAGKLGDLYGRRRMFLVGIVLFVVASVICGSAGSIGVLIALRAVQGIGAALITPCSLSILTATFAPEERGLALGLWSGVLGVGVALGPLVGGVLVDQASWRWVFFINVPIGVLCFAASLAWVKESRDPSKERALDLPGVALSLLGLFALTFGLLKGNDYGWADVRTIGLLTIGVAGLVGFVLLERIQARPMLPLSLFRSATFAGANTVAVFAGFILFGELFFGSLLLQSVMGYSALKTGLALLPLTLLIMVVSPPIGRLLSKGIGPRWIITAGMLLLADSLVLLSRCGYGSNFYDLLPAFVLSGIGFAFVLTSLTSAALAGVPVRHAGIGSAVINATRQVGGTIGLAVTVAVSSAVVNSWVSAGRTRPDGFAHSFDVVMLVSAGVSLAGALVAAVTLARQSPAAVAEPKAEQLTVRPTVSWPVAAPAVVQPLPQGASPGTERVSQLLQVDMARMSMTERRQVGGRVGNGLALVVETGTATGKRIPVLEEVVVGRSEPEPGRLDGDSEISRRHASVSELDSAQVLVEDLASTNGTFLNGYRILAPTVARPGDEIRIGSTVLRLEAGSERPPAGSDAAAAV